MKIEPDYLGDSVYIGPDGDSGLQMTTDSHRPRDAKNIIYLEPQIVRKLVDYCQRYLKSLEKPDV